MPDYSTLILFASAALILATTPGPDMLLIASRSASQSRTAGLLTYFGIATGTYGHAMFAAPWPRAALACSLMSASVGHKEFYCVICRRYSCTKLSQGDAGMSSSHRMSVRFAH